MPTRSSDWADMQGAEARAEEAADLAACRTLLRGGSRSFWAASLLLPRSVREPASALYAFCRLGDDAIDEAADPERRPERLDRLHARLRRAYEGRPFPIPADRALARVVARHAIPRALPEALLEGFAWDAAGRRYGDLPALEAYAARVAGSVGAMMAVLMGARAPAAVARACDLGIAMQLSNIARDVGEDARAGRLYLPLDWLGEAGIDPQAWLARPRFVPAIGAVVARLLAAADVLYARADSGIAALPLACRPGIGAARLLYAQIGREVERNGLDSVAARAVVPAGRKSLLLLRAVARAAWPMAADAGPMRPAARFLVDAVAATPVAADPAPSPTLGGQMVWLIDLFERLEHRQQTEHAGRDRACQRSCP